jgi:hypothetical protein
MYKNSVLLKLVPVDVGGILIFSMSSMDRLN